MSEETIYGYLESKRYAKMGKSPSGLQEFLLINDRQYPLTIMQVGALAPTRFGDNCNVQVTIVSQEDTVHRPMDVLISKTVGKRVAEKFELDLVYNKGYFPERVWLSHKGVLDNSEQVDYLYGIFARYDAIRHSPASQMLKQIGNIGLVELEKIIFEELKEGRG